MHITLEQVKACADDIIALGSPLLTGEIERKSDGSLVTEQDAEVELALFTIVKRYWPEATILAEEQFEADKLQEFLKDGTYISIDPIDGTKPFAAGLTDSSAISVGFIKEHVPVAGIVVQFGQNRAFCGLVDFGIHIRQSIECTSWNRFSRVRSPEPMIGLDLAGSVAKNPTEWEANRRLVEKFGFPRNQPSVSSGIELLCGNTKFWVSAGAKNWDIAATASLVREAGGLAATFDGSNIDWTSVKMPRLLFAESADMAEEVRDIVLNYQPA